MVEFGDIRVPASWPEGEAALFWAAARSWWAAYRHQVVALEINSGLPETAFAKRPKAEALAISRHKIALWEAFFEELSRGEDPIHPFLGENQHQRNARLIAARHASNLNGAALAQAAE